MNKKSLITILTLGVGLAFAGNAYTQSKSDSFYNRTSDFMLVTNYMNPLDRTKTTSIDDLLRGGNVTAIYAIDAIQGLKSRINFLNDERAKKFYSDEERNLLIGRYNSFIAEIAKEQRSPNYQKSLEKLSLAVTDGTIIPSELEGVDDGSYMLVKEGTDKTVGKYSVLALVDIKKGIDIKEKPTIEEYPQIKKIVDKEPTKECLIDEPVVKTPEKNCFKKPIIKDKLVNTEKSGKTLWSLTFGANSNTDFDAFVGNIGFRVYPFENKKIGLGLAGNIGAGKDNQIDSYSTTLSSGRSFEGEKTETNKLSAGLSGELQFGWFILGGGLSFENSIINTDEKILKNGEVVNSNSNSVPNEEFFGKAYAGIEIPISSSFGLGFLGGYDWNNGTYFGIKSNLKLNK